MATSMPPSSCWRVYWPEDASPCQPDTQQALIGWRVGPRCLVVAALVPLQGAAERLEAGWAKGDDGSEAARLCILGEYGRSATSSSDIGVDGSVWLVMEPGPRVRMLHACASRNAVEEERPAPTIAVVRYQRSHHGATALQPRGSTELDCTLRRMARAGSVQRALNGAEAPVLVLPPAAAEPLAPPSPPPPMTRSSLTCVQLHARGMAALGALLRHHQCSEAITGLLVDSVLGVALGLLLWRHGGELHAAWDQWHRQLLHPAALERGAAWLASDPGGFKLNLPLTQRLGAVVVLVAELYTAALQQAAGVIPADWARMPSLALCVAVGALLGATTLLAGGFDLLRALTGHVPFIHASVARLYHLELCTLASLGRLFRGRKWNVLRRRVDSCEYSTQQLLLGTLLFTICVALFPTLAAFHAACAALHLAVRTLQAGLWLLLALLRDLPLHGLALRLCAPERFIDPLRVARCRPCGPEGDDAGVIHFVDSIKEDGVTGAGSVIADTEEGGGGGEEAVGAKPAVPTKKLQAQQTVLRLDYGRVPWVRLFDGYARTGRALRKASPSPGRALGALLTGSLLTEADEGEEEGRPPRLAFFQYRSLPQILVEATLASSSSAS